MIDGCRSQDGVEYPHTPRDKSLWRDPAWLGEHGRSAVSADELLKLPEVDRAVRKAGLLRAEAICLRLYTGRRQPFTTTRRARAHPFAGMGTLCRSPRSGL